MSEGCTKMPGMIHAPCILSWTTARPRFCTPRLRTFAGLALQRVFPKPAQQIRMPGACRVQGVLRAAVKALTRVLISAMIIHSNTSTNLAWPRNDHVLVRLVLVKDTYVSGKY